MQILYIGRFVKWGWYMLYNVWKHGNDEQKYVKTWKTWRWWRL